MSIYHPHYSREDFIRARRKAAFQKVLGALRGESTQLLRYDDVRRQLKAAGGSEKGIQEIPVDAIVGSVSKYDEFDRNFLPVKDYSQRRWVKVKTHVEQYGMPNIEVYKLGEAYFVIDGNHRVSIARDLDIPKVMAHVIEVIPRVPLTPTDDPQSILLKARFADFLEITQLDKIYPDANLLLSFTYGYELLLEHIKVHQYFMGLNLKRDIDYTEAVVDWYEQVYKPVIHQAYVQGLPHLYSKATEADLYAMIAQHRADLEQTTQWEMDTATVATDLTHTKGIKHFFEQIADAIIPDTFESGPPAGTWRAERLSHRDDTHSLFSEILVSSIGGHAGHVLLHHAARLAQRDHGRILGLHVVKSDKKLQDPDLELLKTNFSAALEETAVPGELAIAVGKYARTVVNRAAWVDLVAIGLVRHTGPSTAIGFGTKFNKIVQRSPRPILAVPEHANSLMDAVLVAFDGSQKSWEALYMGTYMASCWGSGLTVLAVGSQESTQPAREQAIEYLENISVWAEVISAEGDVAQTILQVAQERAVNLILIGGFSFQPIFQLVIGSTVNVILKNTPIPVIICR